MNKQEKLIENTMLALQGKLLKENKLTEAFSDSFPDWLKKALQGSSKYNKPKLGNLNIAWDKAKYIPAELPASAGKDSIWRLYRLPVYKLQTSGYNNKVVVYIPGLVDPELWDLNKGQYSKASNLSYKKLKELCTEYGYIDLSDANINTSEKRRERASNKSDKDRRPEMGQHIVWDTFDQKWEIRPASMGYDKSGYKLDPDKYKKILAQNIAKQPTKMFDKLNDIYSKIETSKQKIQDKLNNSSVKDLSGEGKSSWTQNAMEDMSYALKYLSRATRSYTDLLSRIDEIIAYRDSTQEQKENWLAKAIKRTMEEVKDNLEEIDKII